MTVHRFRMGEHEFEKHNNDIFELIRDNDALKARVRELENTIKFLEDANAALQKKTDQLENEIDARIYGIKDMLNN